MSRCRRERTEPPTGVAAPHSLLQQVRVVSPHIAQTQATRLCAVSLYVQIMEWALLPTHHRHLRYTTTYMYNICMRTFWGGRSKRSSVHKFPNTIRHLKQAARGARLYAHHSTRAASHSRLWNPCDKTRRDDEDNTQKLLKACRCCYFVAVPQKIPFSRCRCTCVFAPHDGHSTYVSLLTDVAHVFVRRSSSRGGTLT